MSRLKRPKPPRPPKCVCGSFFKWVFGVVSPSALYVVRNEKGRKYRKQLALYEDEMLEYKIATRTATRQDWNAKRYKMWRKKQGKPIEYHGETIGEIAYAGLMEGLEPGLMKEAAVNEPFDE